MLQYNGMLCHQIFWENQIFFYIYILADLVIEKPAFYSGAKWFYFLLLTYRHLNERKCSTGYYLIFSDLEANFTGFLDKPNFYPFPSAFYLLFRFFNTVGASRWSDNYGRYVGVPFLFLLVSATCQVTSPFIHGTMWVTEDLL